MPVFATRIWKAVQPGHVYPQVFQPGDELPDWAEPAAAIEAGAAALHTDGPAQTAGDPLAPVVLDPANDATDSETPASEPETGPHRIVAKTTRACEITIDGTSAKFRKGVKVYDETARILIAGGHAEIIDQPPEPPIAA